MHTDCIKDTAGGSWGHPRSFKPSSNPMFISICNFPFCTLASSVCSIHITSECGAGLSFLCKRTFDDQDVFSVEQQETLTLNPQLGATESIGTLGLPIAMSCAQQDASTAHQRQLELHGPCLISKENTALLF